MAIIETRLSPRVEQGFTAVSSRMTLIKTLASGQEKRNAQWANGRRMYTADYAVFTPADCANLLAAIEATEGQLYAFRFKDWNDWNATDQPIGLAPGGSAAVQLVKTYSFGSTTKTRDITKPVAGTVTVYQDGVAKAGTISTTTGLFTPTTAWDTGAELTATFEFDVPVRFASDEIQFVMPHRDIREVKCNLIEVLGE